LQWENSFKAVRENYENRKNLKASIPVIAFIFSSFGSASFSFELFDKIQYMRTDEKAVQVWYRFESKNCWGLSCKNQ
jgi:hypothetical protein